MLCAHAYGQTDIAARLTDLKATKTDTDLLVQCSNGTTIGFANGAIESLADRTVTIRKRAYVAHVSGVDQVDQATRPAFNAFFESAFGVRNKGDYGIEVLNEGRLTNGKVQMEFARSRDPQSCEVTDLLHVVPAPDKKVIERFSAYEFGASGNYVGIADYQVPKSKSKSK